VREEKENPPKRRPADVFSFSPLCSSERERVSGELPPRPSFFSCGGGERKRKGEENATKKKNGLFYSHKTLAKAHGKEIKKAASSFSRPSGEEKKEMRALRNADVGGGEKKEEKTQRAYGQIFLPS